MMNDNPIVMEIRKARAEILESYQGDYKAMMRAMMQRQREVGRTVVKAPLQPPETSRIKDLSPRRGE